MLGDAEVIDTVRSWLEKVRPAVVVLDPVMVATSGDRLLKESAEAALLALLPLADLITPNLAELAILLREPQARDWAAALEQGKRLAAANRRHHPGQGRPSRRRCGARMPSSTPGGSLPGRWWKWPGERIPTRNSHGTGCSLSSRDGHGTGPAGGLGSIAARRSSPGCRRAAGLGASWRSGPATVPSTTSTTSAGGPGPRHRGIRGEFAVAPGGGPRPGRHLRA